MTVINALITSFVRDEEGQGLAEYALILALIAVVAIIALIFLGTQVSGVLNDVADSIWHATLHRRRWSIGPPAPLVFGRCAHAHVALLPSDDAVSECRHRPRPTLQRTLRHTGKVPKS